MNSLLSIAHSEESKFPCGTGPLHRSIASLCEANSITCFSDHGKSIIDQGEDDVWASVVPGVCTEFSIHQIIHNCVKCFRGKQLVNCSLDAHLAVVTSHVNILGCRTGVGAHPVSLGVPISWPENEGDGRPEPGKFNLALLFIRATRAETFNQNVLLSGNALLRCETSSDGGDDRRAVAARVASSQ